MAIEDGHADAAALVPIADVVRGVASVDRDRPRVFKSVGMGWEDLVVAAACVTAVP
jgi:ornithine cyclodeaminase